MDKLLKQIEFLTEIDKVKNVFRQSLLSDASRHENDAEHSWHLCMYAIVLEEYAEPGTDMLKVLKMALVHDLVEIYAGDTYLYDEAGNLSKARREKEAADKLYSMLGEPGDELKALWYEFDEGSTVEAQFANACDRLQPIILNYRSKGEKWKENNIHVSQVIEKGKWKTRNIDERVRQFVFDLLDDCVEKGYLLP